MKNKLHPKAVWLFLFSNIVSFLLAALILASFAIYVSLEAPRIREAEAYWTSEQAIFWILLIIFLMILLPYIWARLSYHFYRYELTEQVFRKELGVIYKRQVSIPYDRIQNVDIYRGIFARLLGLSDIHIQTAGAGNFYGEGNLPGLSIKDAEELRDELIRRAGRSKTTQGL